MKFLATTGAVLLPLASVVGALELKPDDESSIKSCSEKYAKGLMSSYKYNSPDLPKEERGYWPKPHYWWASGAIWGGVIEYSQTFGDSQYVQTVQDALVANYGPEKDFIMADKRDQQGNDDQAFWCLATMSAVEYGFPEPANAPASYLEVTQNCFENIMSRWDTKTCGGGLKWQIYPDNANVGGYNYKNSISNGAAFALAARLARYTGESKYADWAKTIYEWSTKVGLIGPEFEVFDGTDDKTNCNGPSDKTEWSYNNAMYLHGSAFMFDVSKGDNVWKDRVAGLLKHADVFFQNPDRVKNVMFERCEFSTKFCNLDQQSFKAYLSRWMAKTAVLAPFTMDTISEYLKTTAVAAGKTCADDGSNCGTRWYKGAPDGIVGIGQQLNAMEVTQALITLKKKTLPGTGGSPAPKPSSSAAPSSSKEAPSSTQPAPTPVESKPVESKPVESKPVESKPIESSKPVESNKPAESVKPVESTKPVEATKPVESNKPVESEKPSENKPEEAKPTFSLEQPQPVDSKPTGSASTSCTESKGAAATPSSNPAESKPATAPVVPTNVPVPAGTPGFQFTPAPVQSSCTCSGMKTVTVWVPPTPSSLAPPAPPLSSSVKFTPLPSPPVVPSVPASKPLVPYPTPSRNATVLPTGTSTPVNSTNPGNNTFLGAATGTATVGFSTLFAAAGMAVMAALL